MHIPDGFLDIKTAVATAAVSAVGLGVALRHIRRTLPKNRVPLIGLAAAFIFAAQMLNFPVAGGTSGHLIGGVLAAVLIGPSAAVLVMSSVLILQCLIFADGGVTALGANIFNMGMLAPMIGYGIYRVTHTLLGSTLRSRLAAAGFAAWCSTVVAAVACAAELALSHTVAWPVAFTAMANIHMLIGIGEAVITTLIVLAVVKVRPDLLNETLYPNLRPNTRELVVQGLIVSAGLAVLIAPFASSWPDGFEKVAASLGFESSAAPQPLLPSPFPGYALPGLNSAVTSTLIIGLAGVVISFALAYALAWKLTPRAARDNRDPRP